MNEADVRLKRIDPALKKAGWSLEQISAEVKVAIQRQYYFTEGSFDSAHKRNKQSIKKADYVLYYKDSRIPLAVIEAKASDVSANEGYNQAKEYAKSLDAKFAFSTNGTELIEYDLFTKHTKCYNLEDFPSPKALHDRYMQGLGLDKKSFTQLQSPLNFAKKDSSGNAIVPRYYQQVAITKAIHAILRGQKRLMLVMATGTGKTYVAAQIVWKFLTFTSKTKAPKILFLADRDALIKQTMQGDFAIFHHKTRIENKIFSKNATLYFSTYQQFVEYKDEIKGDAKITKLINHFHKYPKDFFDMIIVDECHRSSVRDDSSWRAILEYFTNAIQIGLTATPRNEENADNFAYFCSDNEKHKPVFEYELQQGIDDGFLVPCEITRVHFRFEKEIDKYLPSKDKTDTQGNPLEKDEYYLNEMNKKIIIQEHVQTSAKMILDFLQNKLKNIYAKTIVFCVNEEHALNMQIAISNLVKSHNKTHDYVVRITSSEGDTGKAYLEEFMNLKKTFPVIATTSRLLSTGVDTKMVELIVLAKNIGSQIEFEQILGRGTRIVKDKYGKDRKTHFTVLDLAGATDIFAKRIFKDRDIKVRELKEYNEEKLAEIIETEITKEQSKTDEANETKTIKTIEVDGVLVEIHSTTERIYENGKLVSADFREYSQDKAKNLEEFRSLKDFLNVWNKAKRKTELLEYFKSKGILLEELKMKEEFKDLDEFDILLKLCFDEPILSRKERAKKANKLLQSYEGKAREILDTLLTSYAQKGITEIENSFIFQTKAFKELLPNGIKDIHTHIKDFNSVFNMLKESLYSA